MQAQIKRKLLDGAAYDKLITPAKSRDKLISKQAGVPDTLALVRRVATEYRSEVGKLADKLQVTGKAGQLNLAATCSAIWSFVHDHIQYEQDEPGLEQVRHAARSWADRVRGVDCEDYAVFISALLQNLGVAHLLRISAYKGSWQHIYVIVPTDQAAAGSLPAAAYTEDYRKPGAPKRLQRRQYITLDCVTEAYNYEVAPSKTMNLFMPQLLELSGFERAERAAAPVAPGADALLVMSYPSRSGHTIGIGDRGGVFVRNSGQLGALEATAVKGAIGKFVPWNAARAAAQQGALPLTRQIKKRATYRKLVGAGGEFRNPAELPGATDIAACWHTDSNHFVGMDHLGGLYVMDHNDQLEHLSGLAGLDPNDPQLAGWLKNAFKKVGNVYATTGKAVAQAGKFVGHNVAQGVQKGVFDPLNKIPGVKYLADNYGMDLLTTAGGLALTALTGGAAAPALVAVKAGRAASIAAKVVGVANKAKTAAQALSKIKNVAKVASLVQKGVKVVKVAKSVTKLIPFAAQVPEEAQTLTDNPAPLSFLPVAPSAVQDFAPVPMELVQRVDTPPDAPAPDGPVIPLSPDTTDPTADAGDAPAAAYVPTASVTAPAAYAPDATDPYAYAPDATDPYAYSADVATTSPSDDPTMYQDTYDLQPAGQDEIGALGMLGLSTPGVLAAGGAVLALGLAAIYYGAKATGTVRRAATGGLAGTPKKRRRSTSARSTSTRKASGRKTTTGRKPGGRKGRTLNL